MSSSDPPTDQDDASRINQEASSSTNNETSTPDNKEDEMKRAAARKLIERYFYQLTDGCGNPACKNKYCASSGQLKPLTPDEAAAQAIQLFSQEAILCERHPNKIQRTNNKMDNDHKMLSSDSDESINRKTGLTPNNEILSGNESYIKLNTTNNSTSYLTEQMLYDIIDECESTECYLSLIRKLGEVFSSIENLSRSFQQSDKSSPSEANLDETGLKKEDVRSLEGEKDKDEDSSAETPDGGVLPVDLPSVRRAYSALFKLKTSIFEHSLVNALVTLAGNLQMELPTRKERGNQDDVVNVLLIVFEIPALGSGDFLETALPAICRASEWLPVEVQAKLARIWSGTGRSSLRNILENLQQLVTLRVIVTQFHRDFYVQDENVITSATKLMKILFYANILAGVLESPDLRNEDLSMSMDDSYVVIKLNKTQPPVDPLDLWSYYLPFLYSCISFLSVLMLLVCTPSGFVRLFDVVSQFLIKPQFLRDINEEYYACALEEECLRRRLKHVQTTGKYYVSPAPMSIVLNGPFHDDDYKLPDNLLRLRNGELQSGLGSRLVEVETRRKILDKQRHTSFLRRNVLHPIAMILLIGLTVIAVLLVVQNTLSLLIGIKALPLSSKQFTLGVSSLSKLGPFGAALEIVLILYLIATSSIGLYTAPVMSRIRPRPRSTPFCLIIGNCAVVLILSSALPLLSKILGITNFDLLGDFGSIEWLGNFQIVLLYNLSFAAASTLCVVNKFTAKVRRELYARISLFLGVCEPPVSVPNTPRPSVVKFA